MKPTYTTGYIPVKEYLSSPLAVKAAKETRKSLESMIAKADR
jgi:hypothetical protein